MRHMFFAAGRLGVTLVALGGLSLGGLVGCADPTATDTSIQPQALPNTIMFGQFVAHVKPKAGTVTFERIAPPVAYGPNLEPESIDNLPLVQDGTPGTGPAGTVELVTNSTQDNYPTVQTFQANVTLRHFFTRSFANMFVQVTAIKSDSGADISSTHQATNSYGGDTFGLDASKGIWQYTADASTNPGVMGQSPNNSGAQDWVFANPDDADTNLTFAIYGSKGFANYTFGFPNLGYMDACTGGTTVTAAAKTGISPGFDFTLYNVNASTVNIARNGQITIGSTALTASGTAINLPSTSAPHPVIFPFWDNLKYGTGGKMCYQTIGTAPNRQFVVEWRNMDFANSPGTGSSLNFEAYLYEGTGEIDTVYNTMTGTITSAGRENGAKAYVGVQDNTGTVATGEFQTQDYGTGNAYSYLPSPI